MSRKRELASARIASTPPLSMEKKIRGARACNLCGEPAAVGQLRLYKECDKFDQPIDGERTLLFVAGDHPACMDRVDKHPRLYLERRGTPGTFPKLCGGCIYREGFRCTHPRAKINNGEGLKIGLDPAAAIVVCIRGSGCEKPLAHALDCDGQDLLGEREAVVTETGAAS
jgi:hypothetical protein